MKIAYLDCASGISGDMTLAALLDVGVDLAAIQTGIDSLGLPDCRLVTSEVKRQAFRATGLTVEHKPQHAHRHLHHITEMIDSSRLSDRQKDLAKRIFTKLGEAEAKVHGTTLQKVHFHEVGAVDSIADIVGAAIGWDLLGVDRIVASPIPTGTGFIQIAHGRCSIPAPATAELLQGIPLADCNVAAELTTPTGAAILATLVDEFGPLPAMRVDRIGYGAGGRDLAEQPNLLRLLVGETDAEAGATESREQVMLLDTNLDDTTGEMIGYCIGRLWEAGALDVFTSSIAMKKNRPGVTLSVLCRPGDVQRVEEILFRETTTLGVRCAKLNRRTLPRRPHQVETAWGIVAGVIAQLPGGGERFSPEYESCRTAAIQHDLAVTEVFQLAQAAFRAANNDQQPVRKNNDCHKS